MYSLARIKGNEKREAPKKRLFSGLSGAPNRIRTCGLSLRRHMPYHGQNYRESLKKSLFTGFFCVSVLSIVSIKDGFTTGFTTACVVKM